LAAGETIIWFINTISTSASQKNDLAMPTIDIVERLKQHAQAVQVTIIKMDEKL
jgi:hypothetical protein